MSAEASRSATLTPVNLEARFDDVTELVVVPRGVRHNPVAAEECWVMLIETVTTRHTGEVQSSRTRSIDEQLGKAAR